MFSREVVAKISSLLALPYGGWEQDWPIEVADEGRIGEFVPAYDRKDLSSDERDAVMALILASADLYVGVEGAPPPEWGAIEERLVKFHDLHIRHIRYWARTDESDTANWFPLTPYIRRISTEIRTGVDS